MTLQSLVRGGRFGSIAGDVKRHVPIIGVCSTEMCPVKLIMFKCLEIYDAFVFQWNYFSLFI